VWSSAEHVTHANPAATRTLHASFGIHVNGLKVSHALWVAWQCSVPVEEGPNFCWHIFLLLFQSFPMNL
jgi:hypothetical protein